MYSTVEPRLVDTPEKRQSTTLETLHLVPNLTTICFQPRIPLIKSGEVPQSQLYKIHSII